MHHNTTHKDTLIAGISSTPASHYTISKDEWPVLKALLLWNLINNGITPTHNSHGALHVRPFNG